MEDASRPPGRTISQFMWAYQPHFHISVKVTLESVLADIGFDGEPDVLLVGFDETGQNLHSTCVEPEKGPFGNLDLSMVTADGLVHFRNDPESQMMHSNARLHRERTERLMEWSRGAALAEALGRSAAGQGRSFFCHGSVRVDDHSVYVVLSVKSGALNAVPQIKSTVVDRMTVSPSLVHAVLRDVLGRAARALVGPDPGKDLRVLGAESHEIARNATNFLIRSALICSGQDFVGGRETYLNTMTALPYEKRWGQGRIVFAQASHQSVQISLRLTHLVGLGNVHAVRKLMEASGAESDLLSDGNSVYGFGRVVDDYDSSSESIFVMALKERGVWELSHDDQSMMTVRDGIGRLTVSPLNVPLFADTVTRLLPTADLDALVVLAEAARSNEHGAMLVISSDAAAEAERLSPQAWEVDPVPLTPDLLGQLTGMDGGVLVDGRGNCHAIGVILDGLAKGVGDPSRGSRFNNAVRYLGSNPPSAVVVVYSTDGGIDILPKLKPPMDRSEVLAVIDAYLLAAESDTPDFGTANGLWDKLKGWSFYLSVEQCSAINTARNLLEGTRRSTSAIYIVEHDLVPDPAMNDSYWRS